MRISPVTADAVDSTRGPAPSLLAHGIDAAAQALVRDGAARTLAPRELAHAVGVSELEARQAVGAVLAWILDTSGGRASSALSYAPEWTMRVGGMSLDRAMARFGGVAMGPITSSPFVAGGFHAQRVRAAMGLSEAGSASDPNAVTPELAVAAKNLLDFYEVNSCSVATNGVVSTFQAQYNASYQYPAGSAHALVADDRYGDLTQEALDRVISDAQQVTGAETLPVLLTGHTAPASCYPGGVFRGGTKPPSQTPAPGASGSGGGPLPGLPAPGIDAKPSGQQSQAGMFSSPWLLAAGVVAAALMLGKKARRGTRRR